MYLHAIDTHSEVGCPYKKVASSKLTRLDRHMALPEVHEAITEQEIARCFPVFQTLRVHFTCKADFVSRVVRQQALGYHLMYIEDGGQAQAIAGYRIREHLETPEPRCAATSTCIPLLVPCMLRS